MNSYSYRKVAEHPNLASSNGLHSTPGPDLYQNVVVMRHGDRLDFSDQSWAATAARPWDPPLMEDGLVRAFNTGRVILNDIGSPIHRVFVSPFLRCLQTAAQVVAAVDGVSAATGSRDSAAPSPLKV